MSFCHSKIAVTTGGTAAHRSVMDKNRGTRSTAIVMCETHGATPHPESDSCMWPHLVAPSGPLPSMTAAETLDPREAIVS